MDRGKFAEILFEIVEILQKHLSKLSKDNEDITEKESALVLEMLAGRLNEIASSLETFRQVDDTNLVYWIEPPDQNSKEIYYKICMEPLSPDEIIRDQFASRMQSIVFTSATLSTSGNDFKYFQKKLAILILLIFLSLPHFRIKKTLFYMFRKKSEIRLQIRTVITLIWQNKFFGSLN